MTGKSSHIETKPRILLVDDMVPNLRALAHILKSDYTLYFAKNGKEALRLAVKHQPDLIILDVIMPVMDGYETIAALKGNEGTHKIPVIFITGLNSAFDEERALELHAADFIRKPFEPSIVRLRVRNQLQTATHLQAIEEMRSHEKFINILDGMEALITVIDPDTNQILFLNKHNREHFGIEKDYIGQLCHKVLQNLDEPCPDCPYLKLRKKPDETFVWEHREVVKNTVLRKTARMIDWVGGKKAHLEYALDITETKRLASVAEKVYRDPLTGVHNRLFFEEHIKSCIRSASRARSTLSLMMVDIDYFKKYNDTYGHLQGDVCLTLVAETLESCLKRKEDVVARYGGEEFVIILPNTDEHGVRVVAGKILEALADRNLPHEKSTVAGHVTVSIGAVTGRAAHTHTREDYLKLADDMLYKSKEAGRNRYTFAMLP